MSPLQYLAVYVVLFAVGAITLTALGLISTWAIALAGVALAPSGSSRILGVCSRLSKGLDVPVRGVRFLVALITLFTGILPGVLLYLAAGVVMSWSDGPTEDSSPGFASTDRGPVLLGVCRRLAARLDVPVAPVRLLVVLATLFTGVAPGLMLYCLAAFLHTDHARRALGRFAKSLDDIRHDVPGASDRAAFWSAPGPGPRRIGRYRIVGELGRGGMGTVYRGRDEALHRDAAVKVIRPLPGEDAGSLGRFGEEARAAASLASPHIVQIYEFDPAARPPFMAMELVPGLSLQQVVKGRGAFPAAAVIDCALQVLAGLSTAHAAGIVHRDIKPANILLATTGPAAGTYKLTDFGLARSPDRQHTLTASGSLLGTLTYLAPEVALGDEATAASDLYSLGATLHEMLTGRPPLSASSPLKLLRKITTEPIPSIRSQCPDLPADVAAWLDRLVAPDPLDRFPSAASAAAALVALPAAAAATTDLRFMPPMGPAAPPPMPDAAPWHRRATPAADRSRGSAADARLEGVLDRAAILEASGHDLLGEQTVTDIARELNLDAGEVRAILRAHRQGRGGRGRDADSIAGVFGEALGQQDRRGEDGDRWGGASPRVDDRLKPRGPRLVFVGGYLIAVGVALAILLMFGARSVSTARPQPPPPRPVGVAREVVSVPLPQAEADPSAATLPNAFPGHSIPSAQPPNVPPGAVATPFLAPPPRQIFLEIFGNLTVMSAVLLLGLFALGFALAGHAIRRLMRNWP
jgi:serine/threonine-protein kinase